MLCKPLFSSYLVLGLKTSVPLSLPQSRQEQREREINRGLDSRWILYLCHLLLQFLNFSLHAIQVGCRLLPHFLWDAHTHTHTHAHTHTHTHARTRTHKESNRRGRDTHTHLSLPVFPGDGELVEVLQFPSHLLKLQIRRSLLKTNTHTKTFLYI